MSVAIRQDQLWWDAFEALWLTPCECCGMEFAWKDSQLGCQMFLSMTGSGKITPDNIAQVMDGLRRWRASKEWHERGGKFVMSVPTFLGWRRDGMPAAPRWSDRPQLKETF